VLLPADEKVPEADLMFQEFAYFANRALAARGFVATSDRANAQLAVFLDYGIGEPQQEIASRSIPVWGQTGVTASTTTSNVVMYGNQANVSSHTNYTPAYGVTGYRTEVSTTATFAKFVSFYAIDLSQYRATRKFVPVWHTTIQSTGPSNDLRRAFPVLIAGSWDLIATDTGQAIKRRIREESDIVTWFKAPSPGPTANSP
jgi:hypothetical protein